MKFNFRNTGKVVNTNWFITFSSTILGVIIGLFLSNYFNHRKLVTDKNKAFDQVKKEIQNNFKNLVEYNDEIEDKYNSFQYINTKLNTEMDIVIHKDSLEDFKHHLEGFLEVIMDEIEPINNDSLVIKGQLNLNLNSVLVLSDLQTIIWNTYKETNYLSLTKFKCISDVETLYLLFEDFNESNNEWRKNFYNINFFKSKEALEVFLTQWSTVIQKQALLLDFSKEQDSLYETCE